MRVAKQDDLTKRMYTKAINTLNKHGLLRLILERGSIDVCGIIFFLLKKDANSTSKFIAMSFKCLCLIIKVWLVTLTEITRWPAIGNMLHICCSEGIYNYAH